MRAKKLESLPTAWRYVSWLTVVVVLAFDESVEGLLGSPAWHVPGIVVLAGAPHVQSGIGGRAAPQHLASRQVHLCACNINKDKLPIILPAACHFIPHARVTAV